MNELTKRFLKYRAAPKVAAPEIFGPPCPMHKHPLGHYPTDGFLSNEETTQQRFERVSDAFLAGYVLGPLDYRFLTTRGKHDTHCALMKFYTRRSHRWMQKALSQSQALINGGTFSSK